MQQVAPDLSFKWFTFSDTPCITACWMHKKVKNPLKLAAINGSDCFELMNITWSTTSTAITTSLRVWGKGIFLHIKKELPPITTKTTDKLTFFALYVTYISVKWSITLTYDCWRSNKIVSIVAKNVTLPRIRPPSSTFGRFNKTIGHRCNRWTFGSC